MSSNNNNNNNSSEYWKHVILEIELAAYLKTRSEKIKDYDFSVTLPASLRRRVEKILPYEFADYDRNVYIEDSAAETAAAQGAEDGAAGDDDSEADVEKRKKKKEVFNESTCSEIERMDHEFPHFDMNLDIPKKHSLRPKKSNNWCSSFVCQPRKERIKWDSKIYQMERSIWEKTLDEQAEQLMDASAERFTDWINSLGSNHDSDITKDKLKALFSIEGDRKLLASVHTEPKEVKAIAKTVADKWNLPEMAIELKYANYIQNRLTGVPKHVNTVAFGRTIPYRMRPWQPTANDQSIATIFPEELLSQQKLFKGIGHLRSTKALVDFCRHHPKIEKPRYLVANGMFKQRAQHAAHKEEVPLYELLKLKY